LRSENSPLVRLGLISMALGKTLCRQSARIRKSDQASIVN
jgi:hypothetical protein